MDRRSFFKSLLGATAAVVVGASAECFGFKAKVVTLWDKVFKSESICMVDAMFAHEAKRLVEKIDDIFENRPVQNCFSGKIPEGVGFNFKSI